MSLKESFFAAKGENRRENYTLPNGDVIIVGELSAKEWTEIRIESLKHRMALDPKGGKPDLFFDARVIARSCMDAKNNLVFDPADDDELKKIMGEPSRILDPLLAVVNRVNSLGDEYESLKKTSPLTTDSNLSTGSPATQAA